jgi:hypothetical protein
MFEELRRQTVDLLAYVVQGESPLLAQVPHVTRHERHAVVLVVRGVQTEVVLGALDYRTAFQSRPFLTKYRY